MATERKLLHGDGPDLDERRPESAETTVIVRRMDGGPDLVIKQAQLLAHDFFSLDDSSAGAKAFDAQVGKGDPDRISVSDVVAINTTMRARSPHTAWEKLTARPEPLPWLAAIPTDVELFRVDEVHWAELRPLLVAALGQAVGPYRNLSVVTKVLHLKRPHLFPVVDSLVVQQVGGVGRPAAELLDHFRRVGRDNSEALSRIDAHLEKGGIRRTRVRILDALLWASHPAAGLAPRLGHWQHVLAPRCG
jgi:hypothetical protein